MLYNNFKKKKILETRTLKNKYITQGGDPKLKERDAKIVEEYAQMERVGYTHQSIQKILSDKYSTEHKEIKPLTIKKIYYKY